MNIISMRHYPKMIVGWLMYSIRQIFYFPIFWIKSQIPTHNSKRLKFGTIKKRQDKKETKLKATSAATIVVIGILCMIMLLGSINQSLHSSNTNDNYIHNRNMRVEGQVLTNWNESVNPLNKFEANSWQFQEGRQPLELGKYGPEQEGVPSIHVQLANIKLQYEIVKSKSMKKDEFKSPIQNSINGNATLATSILLDNFNLAKSSFLLENETILTNASQLFAPFVFFPCANGLQNVDGNLIIQAAMASDQATKKHFVKKQKNGSKKKIKNKQSIYELQFLNSHFIKIKDDLSLVELKASKNITIGHFVTTKDFLSKNMNFSVEANNLVSKTLLTKSLKQWMFGGLHGIQP